MGREGPVGALRVSQESAGGIGANRSPLPGHAGSRLPQQQPRHQVAARSNGEDCNLLDVPDAIPGPVPELAGIKEKPMADDEKGIVTAGFSLLWRRQGILWWVFVVNFVCGALGTAPAALQLSRALHHSMAGQPLSRGFDLGMFFELLRLPSASLMRSTTSSYLFAFVFFLFMLFVSGGILETYRQDRGLTTGDFFAASGAFFWRLVRLMLLSIIPFVMVGAIYQGLDKLSDYFGNKAVADQVGIFSWWASMAVFLLLALAVRLWFDVAQVRAVAKNERGMWRNLWKAYRITWGGLGSLCAGKIRSTAVVRCGPGAIRGQERTRHVAQPVESLPNHLGGPWRPVLDVLSHRPVRLGDAGPWGGNLGASAADRYAGHICSAGTDSAGTIGDAILAARQRDDLVPAICRGGPRRFELDYTFGD